MNNAAEVLVAIFFLASLGLMAYVLGALIDAASTLAARGVHALATRGRAYLAERRARREPSTYIIISNA